MMFLKLVIETCNLFELTLAGAAIQTLWLDGLYLWNNGSKRYFRGVVSCHALISRGFLRLFITRDRQLNGVFGCLRLLSALLE